MFRYAPRTRVSTKLMKVRVVGPLVFETRNNQNVKVDSEGVLLSLLYPTGLTRKRN